MNKHTPGPLKAVQIIIENSSCTWAVQRKSIREQWGKPSIATYIDNEADARLFAAAPAMYEALHMVSTILYDIADSAGDVAEWNEGGQMYELGRVVKTALAQAEGRG